MDGNYHTNALASSLKTMSAVKVVEQVLLCSRKRFVNCHSLMSYREQSLAERFAASKVRDLKLPLELRELLENLIAPVLTEMNDWFKKFYRYGNPVLTPFGTVDWHKSANAILSNENMKKLSRFEIACDHCYEDLIYELFKELTPEELATLHESHLRKPCSTFPHFWRRVFSGHFGCVDLGGRLPQKAYNEGFKLAMEERNNIAVRHFINDASPEMVNKYGNIYLPKFSYNAISGCESPATFCLIISKLGEQANIHIHAHALLNMLLRYPYQPLFMVAAHSLMITLQEERYWKLVDTLFRFIEFNMRDFNYRKLFTAFWLAGSCYRHGSTLPGFFSVIANILWVADVPLLNFVLTETCTELKEAILSKFLENKICVSLVHTNNFKLLEHLIRCCGARNSVLLEFKLHFIEHIKKMVSDDDFYESKAKIGFSRDKMYQFVEMMDKIIAEK